VKPQTVPTDPAWLGRLPVGWTATRLRRLATIRNGCDHKQIEVDEGGFPVYGSGGQFARCSSYLHRGPSVLLGRKGTIDRPQFVTEPFWTVDTSFYTEIASDVDPRFFFYVCTTIPFDFFQAGTALPSMTQTNLYSVRCAMPTRSTQRQIGDYLDCETARIDGLIDRKQRFINLLLEKRTALITHAVTKGLDPKTEMRDSGAPWFGSVPGHWRVVRLGHFARVHNGSTPSRNEPSYWVDGTIPWMSSGSVNQDRIAAPSELITEQALRECSLSVVPAGSVVVGLVGQGRTRGMVALLDIDATINQNMAAIRPSRLIDARFLQYQLQHMYAPLREYGRGGNQAALNCELVADLRILLPPLAEQTAVARYLDDEASKLDSLVAKTADSIGLLAEYRAALITTVVTGQIDITTTN
jgi:type I restriction enzyme S subunit